MATTAPTPAEAPQLEADDSFSGESDYSTDRTSSSTASLSSSIQEHIYANGRRYHLKSHEQQQYLLPSDEKEQDRLDMMHHLQLLLLGGDLYTAKLDGDPANVLDCGTGTGIWALDFGAVHPGSKVIGVDLAPIQPTWTYPNVVFEVDDLERDWTYRENQFDFIHSRMVGTAIKDWPRYVSQMFKHTRPGGLVEISEHQFNAVADDDSIPPNSPISRYLDALQDGLEKVGLPVKNFTPEFFVDLLKEAGFVDVQVRTFRVPWGKWAKNKDMKYLGAVALEVFTSGAEAYALQVFTSVLGIKEDEAKKMCEEGLAKIRTNKEHRFHYQWQIVGRKPRAEEVA